MTQDQIERIVEKKFDRLDAKFMADPMMTQEQYDAQVAELRAWEKQAREGRAS